MDYTKQCWACGKVTMVSKGSYYQCTECGTTWNALPTLREYQGLATEKNPQTGLRKYKPKMMSGKVKGGPPLKPLRRPSDAKYGK